MPTTKVTPNILTQAHGPNTIPIILAQDLYSSSIVAACMLKRARSSCLLFLILRITLCLVAHKTTFAFFALCLFQSDQLVQILIIVFAQYAIPQYLHTILPAHINVPGVLLRIFGYQFLDQNPSAWFFIWQRSIKLCGLYFGLLAPFRLQAPFQPRKQQ